MRDSRPRRVRVLVLPVLTVAAAEALGTMPLEWERREAMLVGRGEETLALVLFARVDLEAVRSWAHG